MEPAQHLSYLRADVRRVADAVRAGRDRPVASCPGWTVADLAVHLGIVHRWANEAVTTRATERPRGATERYGVPADRPDLAEWYEEAATTLIDTLSSVDPETPVWSFGTDRTARFWSRRQAHETLVHRWDAQEAIGAGAVDPLDAEHAADAVDELLVALLPPRIAAPPDGPPRTFHFHRTDGPGEWFVTVDPDGYRAERAHAKGAVAVRGSAADLLLFLWSRSTAGVEVFGADDGAAAAGAWFSVVPRF